MAVTTTKVQSILAIKYKVGMDAKGNDQFKTQRFSKVKVNAPDEKLFEIGTALGTLLKYPVNEVLREDDQLIVNA